MKRFVETLSLIRKIIVLESALTFYGTACGTLNKESLPKNIDDDRR